VHRFTTTLALALCLVGCYSAGSSSRSATPSDGSAAPLEAPASAAPSGDAVSPAPSSDTVKLATAEGHFPERSDGMQVCPYHFNLGLLMVDPQYGTAAQNEDGMHPLIWPLRYTARRLAEGEVAVLNRNGAVVATTGKSYRFWAPEWGADGGPVEAGDCVDLAPEGEIQTPY
jgi:hypothetical protein